MTLILALTFSVMIVSLPLANAHTPPKTVPTYAFIHVAPDPVGVDQTATVGFWLNPPPPTAFGPYGDRYQNMTVTVTKPDGQNDTLGPFTSDDTGGTYTTYTPNQVGTYTFQMTYPGGQILTGGPIPSIALNPAFINDTMAPSTSNVATLIVQQEPVGGIPETPLPTSYWQTPINAMNVHNWYKIGGASLLLGGGYSVLGGSLYNASTNYNPYTTAPKTAHVLWTRPIAFGGVLGGKYGGTTTYGNYYSTAQYEHKFEPIIMNGFLYYTEFPGSSTTPTANICINLRTAQTVWRNDASNYGGGSPEQTALTPSGTVAPLAFGQILDFVSPNQYGGIAYLWTRGTPDGIYTAPRTTTYSMFDAMTGKYILSVVNATTSWGAPFIGGPTFDPRGNIIGYYVNNTAGTQTIMGPIKNLIGPTPTTVTSAGPTLNMWNSTQCIQASDWFGGSASGWQWRPPQNGIIPFSNGIIWSQPLPTDYLGNPLPAPMAIRHTDSGVVITYVEEPATSLYNGAWGVFAGYRMDTGEQLWINNITLAPFAGDVNTGYSYGDGVFTISLKSTFEISGYNMTTGELIWTTPLRGDNGALPDSYDAVGGYTDILAGDTLYYAGFGGDIWSINMLTGNINWYTNTTKLQGPAGTNSPYGIWPIWSFANPGVAEDVLFLSEGHEYSPPLFLGAQQLAINTTNGQLVWKMTGFNVNSHPTTAYGIMVNLNAYDNQVYAWGKGPSKTTVTAPSVGVTTATPVTIRGTVTDISAGSQQEAVAANFPNGLPCVSDESMTPFMEAVYEQQPMPTNVAGVPVTISVLDPNGDYQSIGTAISDASGFYSLVWTPEIEGNFIVYANFEGTQSYYGSSAETSVYASAAPSPSGGIEPEAGPLITIEAAILIAVVVIAAIAVVAYWVLRRR